MTKVNNTYLILRIVARLHILYRHGLSHRVNARQHEQSLPMLTALALQDVPHSLVTKSDNLSDLPGRQTWALSKLLDLAGPATLRLPLPGLGATGGAIPPLPTLVGRPRAQATTKAAFLGVVSNAPNKRPQDYSWGHNYHLSFGSGGWIRTNDLRVMSPTSCHCLHPAMIACGL